MANGHPPLVAPPSGGSPTSPWFALRYVKNAVPDISAHDLVVLVSSIGAETKGRFTFASIMHATKDYKEIGVLPAVSNGSWHTYVGRVIHAASTHHHKNWISGFSYNSKDIGGGTGGPSNLQKVADSGAANAVVGGVKGIGSAFGDVGKLLKSPIMLIVLVLVIVLIVSKK